VITLIFGLLCPGSTFLILVKELFFVNLCITIFVYPFWLVPTRKIWEILKTNKDYNSKIILTIIVFFSVCVMTLWFKNNYFEFNRIRKYGNNQFVEIILNDKSKVSPTDTIRYIGRTEKYFFYWDRISKVKTVYPSNEVSKIIVK
jgi:hypothetical protein